MFDLLISGGSIVLPGLEPFPADLAINFEAPLDLCGGTIAGIGDLENFTGRSTLQAEGLFLHPDQPR